MEKSKAECLIKYLKKEKIKTKPIVGGLGVAELIEKYFTAFNGARLREVCHLLKQRILKPDVTVGLSIAGALTPAGLGISIFAPLIENGFVDYIVSTGANIYHDIHYGIGHSLYMSTPFVDDRELRKNNIVRIYDIIMSIDVLLETDNYVFKLMQSPEFQKKMSTAELHNLLGKYVAETQKQLFIENDCLLAAAYKYDVPIYTSSPGDSTLGLNAAALKLLGNKLEMDVERDVIETTAIVYDTKSTNRKSGIVVLGGGSPKNFLLQTEPQLQEIMKIEEKGHDYFIQITDARPDTGGLSGATPSEAVSWGKIDMNHLSDTIVCYLDSSIALPLIAAYIMNECEPREPKRLYKRRDEMVEKLTQTYKKIREKK